MVNIYIRYSDGVYELIKCEEHHAQTKIYLWQWLLYRFVEKLYLLVQRWIGRVDNKTYKERKY